LTTRDRITPAMRKGSKMSRRTTIMALAASAIFGIGFMLTVSDEASARGGGGFRAGGFRAGGFRAGGFRAGGVRAVGVRGGVYRGGFYRPGVAVGVGAAAVGAAAVGAAAAGAYYGPGYPGYYGAAAPIACGYGYYYYAPYNRCVPTP